MNMRAGKSRRRLAILLICIALAAAGCSSGGKNSSNDGNQTQPAGTGDTKVTQSENASSGNDAGQTSEPQPEEKREPVTYYINNENPNINWDNPVAEELTRRTGVTIKFDITPNEKEKLTVWLASGDYPELLNIWPDDVSRFAQAGALVDLTDLIPQHAPNIMKAFNNDLSSLKDPNDGRIYSISEPPLKKGERADTMGYFHVQFEVLKEAGYPKIETLDDLYEVITAYAKKHPEIADPDGNMQKTIGFTTFGGENQLFNQLDGAAKFYAGFQNATPFAYMVDDQYNAKIRLFEPGYTDYFKYLNKLNADGLLDQEAIIQTKGQMDAKCATGRVLALPGAPWVVNACNTALIENGMPERQFAHFDLTMPGATILDMEGAPTTKRLAITKNVKDPIRALQFIDDLFKLENQILIGWGIEGDYYTVVDGKRVPTESFIERFKKERHDPLGLSYPPIFLTPRFGYLLEDGDYSNFEWTAEFVNAFYTEETHEVLAKYGAKTWADLTRKPDKHIPVTWGTPPEEALSIQQNIVPEYNKAATKAIMESDASKIDAIWAEYHDYLKGIGLDKLEQLITDHVRKLNGK
jgi:putative aldouronate transport system substrate-binding protein